MITIAKTKSYTTADGQKFDSLIQSQGHEISEMLRTPDLSALLPADNQRAAITDWIITNHGSLLAILSTKERKARVPKAKPGRKVKAVVAALHPAAEAMPG